MSLSRALLLLSLSCLQGMNSSHDDDQRPTISWCDLDTGFTTITDDHGYRHGAHISLTRDGSVWVRVGRDYSSFDWSLVDQRRVRVQTAVLDDDMLTTLHSLSYTTYCVLTDLDLSMTVEASWNPSYVTVFDAISKATSIVSVKNIRDCRVNTTLQLSADKQGLRCDGWGEVTACGMRNMPETGLVSQTWFLKYVNLDLYGPDHWFCAGQELRNFYTFAGSYYYAFVKLASCNVPSDSRSIGNEVKLRRHKDSRTNVSIIPDPTQTILADGSVIQAWQIYAQIVSIEHSVYLQVWHPLGASSSSSSSTASAPGLAPTEDTYVLVGQTFIQPTELRFHERALPAEDFVRTSKGDVLGLYFPQFNPIGWSSVPCGSSRQSYLYVDSPTNVTVGRTLAFKSTAKSKNSCRIYSMQALFANKSSAKLVENWSCPSSDSSIGSLIRSDSAELKNSMDSDLTNRDGINRASSSSSSSPSLTKNVFASSDGLEFHSELPQSPDGGVAPMKLMLIVLSCLVLTMIVTGIVSYFKAIQS